MYRQSFVHTMQFTPSCPTLLTSALHLPTLLFYILHINLYMLQTYHNLASLMHVADCYCNWHHSLSYNCIVLEPDPCSQTGSETKNCILAFLIQSLHVIGVVAACHSSYRANSIIYTANRYGDWTYFLQKHCLYTVIVPAECTFLVQPLQLNAFLEVWAPICMYTLEAHSRWAWFMLHTDVTESGLGVLKKQQYISPRGFPPLGQAVSMCENTIAIVS